MATTEISIKANLTQLRKELALIPGITDKEAKAMSQELIKQLKKSEKAAKSAATGSKQAWQGYGKQVDKTSESVNQFTDSAGDADSTLMGFAGVLDLVNPALGDMARTTGDVLAGTESLGKAVKFSNPIFIALAVVAAALGAAYAYLSSEEEKAAEAADRVADASKRAKSAQDTEKGVVHRLFQEYQFLTGAIDEYELARQRSQQSAVASMDADIAAQEAAIVLVRERLDLELEKEGAWFSFDPDPKTLVHLRWELTLERRKLDALAATAKALGDKASANANLRAEASKTAKADADGSKSSTEWRNAQKEAADQLAASEQTLSDIVTDSNDDQVSAMQKIENSLTAQLELIDLIVLNHADNAELMIQAEEAKAAAIQNTSRARYKLLEEQDEEYADSVEDRQKEQTKNNEKHIEDRTKTQLKANAILLAAASYSIGAVSDLESQAAAWSARLAEDGEQQNLTAAKAAFNIAKAAALAGIAVNTAGAIMKITEQTGVFAPPLVAITAALGLSQAALVASEQPSFHAGGLIGHGSAALNPDERSITARAGEGVVSQSGMARLGAGGLDSLNRGTGGGGQIIVTQQYQHRAFGAMVQRDIQLPNSPLRKALRGTGRVGHKSRSN